MFDKYMYEDKAIVSNQGKLEPFSFLYGMGLGIIMSALQALTQYLTAGEFPAFLGMAFINAVLGVFLIVGIKVVFGKFMSAQRAELLKIPEKGKQE